MAHRNRSHLHALTCNDKHLLLVGDYHPIKAMARGLPTGIPTNTARASLLEHLADLEARPPPGANAVLIGAPIHTRNSAYLMPVQYFCVIPDESHYAQMLKPVPNYFVRW